MMGTKMEISLSKAEPGSWSKLNLPRDVRPVTNKANIEEAIDFCKENSEESENKVDVLNLDDLDLSSAGKFTLSSDASVKMT